MSRTSLLVLAAAATVNLLAQQPRPPQAQARYEIDGTVVDHRTQAPLGSVMVSITPVVNARGETLSVVTGADGGFHFTGLAQAKYALNAERRGQPQQQFHAHGQFSTAIVTGPGVDSQHIVFPLFEDARIAGTVVDEDGDPVASAQVLLLKKHILDGKSRMNNLAEQNTTTAGAFHFGHLRPGTYYLAVVAHPWYTGGGRTVEHIDANGNRSQELEPPPAMLDRSYPITYSGDATDPSGAQPIDVPEGVSVAAPVHLQAVPSLHVSIPDAEVFRAADNSANIRPMSGLFLMAPGPGGVEIPTQTGFTPRFDGSGKGQREAAIAPGTYVVRHQVPGSNGQATTSDDVISVNASGPAVVTKSSAATIVSGHVTYNGPVPQGTAALVLIGERHREGALIQPDGSFAFPQGAVAGRYRLVLQGETALAVQSIGDGKHVKSGNTLTIPENAASALEISVVAAPVSNSTFNGTALRDGKPAAGALVLLLPENLDDIVAIGRDQSDSDGTFAIPNVQAGHYTLLAFDCDQDDESCGMEYRDPAVMKPYLARGKAVTLPTSSSDPMEVTVIAPANESMR